MGVRVPDQVGHSGAGDGGGAGEHLDSAGNVEKTVSFVGFFAKFTCITYPIVFSQTLDKS